MAKGKKTGGRREGSENKLTGLAKDNVAAVFTRLGGSAAMAKWAKANQTEFYKLYARLIPIQVAGDGGGPVKVQAEWILQPVKPNGNHSSGS
jgi:hypothetical protein